MNKVLIALFCLSLALPTFSQINKNPWQDTPETYFAKKSDQRTVIPQQYRTLSLNLDKLQDLLLEAPLRHTAAADAGQPTLDIPMPDGGFQSFRIVEAPVFHPELTAKYPYIRSYAGWSDTDPTAYLRFGVTQKGFHAVLFSARNSTVYIDAYAEGNTNNYISYFKKDLVKTASYDCLVEDAETSMAPETYNGPAPKLTGDCKLRTYALALACTGEYAQFHGGTVPLVMAEYAEAMTRVNGIYERETAVTMQLVPNTDLLIFLNATTDPYTNNNGSTMLNQNQTTCNNIIGNANYDIGHVFSTGGGGIAFLNAVCSNNNKAKGVTGGGSPTGDPFWVDYVAHEMGHQFGGNHTQNNSCNRNNATAMEPGSASTIMGYAGICSPNVQNNSDDYFHAVNLDEITAHITGAGNGCATATITGNNAPEVSVASASYAVPVSTPLKLSASGTDVDGNALTYCWEQMDNAVAPMPPQPSNAGGPAFRSLDPQESPDRYLPELPAVIAGTTPTWEVLPAVSRSMFFRCTVRDNFPGAGCTAETDVILNFTASAGPFLVTEPNTSATVWFAGSQATVNWNVANTSLAPVNCSQVDLLLSVDGGQTYPYLLLSQTANDGTETVMVPIVTSSQARVMVRSVNNVFYDISNQNFTIEQPPVPTFLLAANPLLQTACGDDTASATLTLQPLAGFNENITLTASGAPAGASVEFSAQNPATLPANVTLNISNLQDAAAGTYNVTITAAGVTETKTAIIQLILPPAITAQALPQAPADGATGQISGPTPVSWQPMAGASSYYLEVAQDPSFGSLFYSTAVAGTSHDVPGTTEQTVYYWRVRGRNDCYEGPFSPTYAFQTAGITCDQFSSTTTPVAIDPSGVVTVTNQIPVPISSDLFSARVNLDIAHTYTGDLIASLQSPQGTTVSLFDRPGVPASTYGCDGDNVVASIYDNAPNTATMLENACAGSIPSISGDYQPIQALSALKGQNPAGNWTLAVQDAFPEDGGAINNWSLELCVAYSLPPAVLIKNELLLVQADQTGPIDADYLWVDGAPAEEVVFTLLSLPSLGSLQLNGDALQVGDVLSQNQINSGLLTYVHSGNLIGADDFHFDVVNSNGGWLHNQVFNIQVAGNNLSAAVEITSAVSCHGAADAVITVSAAGGTEPLSYALGNGNFQAEPVFTNIAPGTYVAYVQDAAGFIFSTNAIVVDNAPLLTVAAVVLQDTVIAAANGGTGTLLYGLNGGTLQPSPEFPDLPNGDYTIAVVDENGCTAFASANVFVAALEASATVTQSLECFGQNTGEITATATGGNPPYQYSLNGGTFQSGNVFSGLPAGTYQVEIKDEDGVIISVAGLFISSPPALTLTASATGTVITASGSGGTGLLLYNLNGGAFQTGNAFNVPANGTYLVGVLDENGCLGFDSVVVNVPQGVQFSTSSPSCNGLQDGVINISGISGGIPPYLYALNGGSFTAEVNYPGLGPGTYEFTVQDAAGNQFAAAPIVLVEPPLLEAVITTDISGISIAATGGTPPYAYSIDGGQTYQSESEFTGLPGGSYSVLIRDANDCAFGTSVTGMEDLQRGLSFDLMPNPGDGLFTLRMEVPQSGEVVYQVFDAVGRLVYRSESWSAGAVTEVFDLRHLPSGTYEVKVNCGRYQGVKKMVIAR
ncbi:MAG: hypothetical protein RI973_1025 [Bacteroidota bacterium]|jgi:subtilisin-like proprotein convertase family protein